MDTKQHTHIKAPEASACRHHIGTINKHCILCGERINLQKKKYDALQRRCFYTKITYEVYGTMELRNHEHTEYVWSCIKGRVDDVIEKFNECQIPPGDVLMPPFFDGFSVHFFVCHKKTV